MPISKENEKLYPGGSIRSPEWLAIRAFIRARAGDRCEGCGICNLAYGVRIDGEFTDLGLDRAAALIEYEYAKSIVGLLAWGNKDTVVDMSAIPKLIRIVCTVAHFDRGLTNHHTTNLRFWCQQCHLRHDAKAHGAQAKKTRDIRAGQAELL